MKIVWLVGNFGIIKKYVVYSWVNNNHNLGGNMKIHNLLCAIFLASRLLFALSTEEVKILVSQAASFSSEDLTSRAEKPLSLLLLDLNLLAEKQVNPDVIKDFYCFKVSDIDRKEMLSVIRHEQQDRYSFVEPQHITKCEYEVSGNTAKGNIAFEINDLYRGKVEFTAQRNENKWQIMSFTLRHYGLRVVYQQEKWQMVYLPTRFAIIRFTSKAIYASRWFESQISSERKICDLDNLENSSAWLKNFAQQSTLQEISQMKIVIHASESLWEKVKSFMAIVARHSIYKLYITHDGKTIVKNYLPFDAGIVSTGHEIQPKIIVMVNRDTFSVGKNSFSGQEKYKSLATHLDGLLKEYSSSAIAFEIRASDDTPYGNIIRIIDICNNIAQSTNKKSVVKFSLASPSSSDISIYEEKVGYLEKEMPHESKMIDPVIEDPVVKDVEDDFVETDRGSNARDYVMSDLPFDSNFGNEAIGIGGGAGAEGHFDSRFEKKFPSSVSKQRNSGCGDCFDRNGNKYMSHDGVVTLAMCKLHKLISRSPLLRNILKKAVDFIIKAQNPESGG